jgi:tetratricopeptide (TPR) repeat protein
VLLLGLPSAHASQRYQDRRTCHRYRSGALSAPRLASRDLSCAVTRQILTLSSRAGARAQRRQDPSAQRRTPGQNRKLLGRGAPRLRAALLRRPGRALRQQSTGANRAGRRGRQAAEFKAAAALENVTEEDGDKALMNHLYNAATAYSQLGMAEEAIGMYEQVLATGAGADKWAVHNSIGLLQYDLERFPDAIASYTKAFPRPLSPPRAAAAAQAPGARAGTGA